MSVSTITPGNMRDMEKKFMQETGYPGLLLMEHAAQAVVHALLQFTHHTALFLCGTGNNGGDGMAAARLFAQAGGTPIVWLCGKLDALQHDARINGLLLKPLGIDTKELEEELPEMPISCDAVVDALFGTGLTRPLGGIERRVVSCISSWNIPVISIDIPSGVDAETGEDGGCAIHATLTVTFHRAKPGHYLYPGRQWTGRLVVADIGIPQTPEQGDGPILWTDEDIMRLLPPRAPDAHKGTFGHALIIAGSMGMAGAACLCAQAALHGGAGLVTIACPRSIVPIVQQLVPCAMAAELPEKNGMLCAESAKALSPLLHGKHCVAVGPGLGRGDQVFAALTPLLDWHGAQIWDADALFALATHPNIKISHLYMTPHPGEAAQLLNVTPSDITKAYMRTAQVLQERFGGSVLLKGATTVITDGVHRGFSVRGCPGMAKGGSGDILTGLCAAMICQGLYGFEAFMTAAYLHGSAGERAAVQCSERTMTALDLIAALR